MKDSASWSKYVLSLNSGFVLYNQVIRSHISHVITKRYCAHVESSALVVKITCVIFMYLNRSNE
jgi:hypothetical protein